MTFFTAVVHILFAATAVNGNPLSRRATLPTSTIVGLPEAVPNNVTGQLYQAYQPYLEVLNGCVPYPAVDANGNTNEGLPITGSQNSGCRSNLGQIYARGVDGPNGRYAIMYSWYMPKDSPSKGLGHRHEWEGVIVWLASGTSTSASNILAVCPSAHGDWNCSKLFLLAGTGPLVSYFSIWPVNHQMWLGAEQGGQQPLIAWESLPDAAKSALQTTNFASATVPFKDSTFAGNIAKATF
ncbi:necrosis inducing protein [Rhexocercosporidium sp. MPI-PUGE-AT-0058]|nr:necrosis inducing protein [Rhexocercosporidium sp. MPI-PUGE-AT-0058]